MAHEHFREVNGELVLSSQCLADVMGVSTRTLGNWASQGCPKLRAGWWPLARVLQWRGMSGDGKPDTEQSAAALKVKYDADLKRLQSEQLELKNAIARGEFVRASEIVGELSRLLVELKLSLMSLSRKIAVDVAPFVDQVTARRIEQEVQGLVVAALERMAVGEKYVAPKKPVVTGKRK